MDKRGVILTAAIGAVCFLMGFVMGADYALNKGAEIAARMLNIELKPEMLQIILTRYPELVGSF